MSEPMNETKLENNSTEAKECCYEKVEVKPNTLLYQY